MTVPDLSLDFVITVHDEILAETGGLPGFAGGGIAGVNAALQRVANHGHYAGLDDIFGIAAMYAEAIARGHVFNDANKRTGLACAITYLKRQGVELKRDPILEDLMVELAKGTWGRDDFAWLIWRLSSKPY